MRGALVLAVRGVCCAVCARVAGVRGVHIVSRPERMALFRMIPNSILRGQKSIIP